MAGAAQDPTAGRGGVKDPRRSPPVPRLRHQRQPAAGMAPILDATPHHGEAWVEPVQQELGGTSGAPGAQQLTSRPSAPGRSYPRSPAIQRQRLLHLPRFSLDAVGEEQGNRRGLGAAGAG
jgi:hypothetical protein